MKKLLILFAILLLGGIGYFTYIKWVEDSNLTNWSFIPENALIVLESPNLLSTLDGIKETEVWKNASSLPLFVSSENTLNALDTIGGKGNFQSLFNNTNTLISLHQVSSESFDFLFVVEIDNLSKHTFVGGAIAHFKDFGYSKKTREYLGFTITELRTKDNSDVFTFIFYKNYFIGSFSSFLVEDGIRTVSNEHNTSFNHRFDELEKVTKLEKDQGNIYLNLEKFNSIFNGVLKDNSSTSFAKSAFLDLKVSDQNLNLTGFTFLEEPTEYLSAFSQNPGSGFDMAEIIPNQSAWVYHYNLSNPSEFGSKLSSYLLISDNDILKRREELLINQDFDVNYAFNLIDEEIALVTLEPKRIGRKDQLLFLEIKDMGEAFKFFNSVDERASAKKGDTTYLEYFGDYEIRKLPVPEFPSALLGEIADGFQSLFYTQYRNYLIFSNNLLQLKNLTLAIDNEDTWSKSLKVKKLLDQANQAANFSLFINTPRAWNQTVDKLKDSWAGFAKDNQFAIRNLEFISLQFSAVDDKFYTNFTAHQSSIPSSTIANKVDIIESVTLNDFIITKPYLITNHSTKEKEIVVQDSSYYIHQLTNQLEPIWSKSVESKIITNIEQIDYYKNGKLQIIFATSNAIHIIDRNGEYVPGFPKSIPGDKEIAHFSIIDYDNSKNYRFGIADIKGNVYLTNKEVKPLKGWKPKSFDSPLVQAPQHYRIGRRDVITVIQENGKINALSRRGEYLPKFPLDLNTNLESPAFVKETNDLSSSSIKIVTKGGESVEVSLTGRLIDRNQFYKPTSDTKFRLLKDVSRESFIILRKTERKHELLDETGKSHFEKDYFTNKKLHIQYYKLGGGIDYVVMTDSGGAYLYIYNMEGTLVTGRPLTATMPISMIKYENEYQIYRVVDKNLELISLSF
ncbi:MAG: hypothetical protein JXR03_01755 [Cyclobacteriaceae bacterium]